jgi:hypothetical protein
MWFFVEELLPHVAIVDPAFHIGLGPYKCTERPEMSLPKSRM